MTNEGKITVSDVNNAVQQEVPELDAKKLAKQQAKEEAQAKQYWNTMITRKEAYQMVNDVTGELNQRLQLLMVQNRTLLEILQLKEVATEEEINELSKQVIESIFGPATVEEALKGETTDETPLAD